MWKRKTINAYVDGKFLCDVVQAGLDKNKLASEMKKIIIRENAGHKVEFRVETMEA